ncbi:MAG TPA: response regulator [Ktedonobacterales bacterium]|jgi:CheY-like chemotaxis protein
MTIPTTPPAAPATRRVWRVLVVDDEENLNWSLVNSLRKDSYAAEGAHTGEQAQRMLASQPYDIVISDVKMPGMDGFELLQWVRQNRPQTRVVMMTAFGSPTDRATALRGGVIAYLEKPFDLVALKEELRRLTSAPGDQRTSGPAESEGYDLLEVVRVLSLARRDIALTVESNGRVGRLRFLHGDLIWAEAGEAQGDDAFVLLTAPRLGRAQPEAWDGRSGRNITQPLAQLIFTAMLQRDRPAADGQRPPSQAGAPGVYRSPASQPMRTGTPLPAPQPMPQAMPQAAPQPGGQAMMSNGFRGTSGVLGAAAPENPAFAASSVFAMSRGSDALASPTTAALAPLAPVQINRVRAILEGLAEALPPLSGVAVLRPDGMVVAQRWVNAGDAPGGPLAHLAASAQAAVRALLLSGWGDLEEISVVSQERSVLMRRVGRGDRAALALLVVARNVNLAPCRDLLAAREGELSEALR